MDEIERIITNYPYNDEHRELIRSFLGGGLIDEDCAQVARDFTDDFVKVLRGLGDATPELQKEISEKLRSARLDPDRAFTETVLHRLADDPAAAIKHIEVRAAASTARNSMNARSPRVSRHDWWAERIDDCVDDHPDATPGDIYEYLLQIDGVSFTNGMFRYDGPDMHRGIAIEPLSKPQVRAKMHAAKKRAGSIG
jgi:hypothetical protein